MTTYSVKFPSIIHCSPLRIYTTFIHNGKKYKSYDTYTNSFFNYKTKIESVGLIADTYSIQSFHLIPELSKIYTRIHGI